MQHVHLLIAAFVVASWQSLACCQSELDDDLRQQFDNAVIDLIADQGEVTLSFSALYLREHFSDSPQKPSPEIAGEWGQLARKRRDGVLRFDSQLWSLSGVGRNNSLPESTLQLKEKLFANSPHFGEFKAENYKRLRNHISDPFGLSIAGSGEHHANKVGDTYLTEFFRRGELKSIRSVSGDLIALMQFTKNYCCVIKFGKAVDFRPVDVEGRRIPNGVDVTMENFRKFGFNYRTQTKWIKVKRFWVPSDIAVHNFMLPNSLEDLWTWRFREWSIGLNEEQEKKLFDPAGFSDEIPEQHFAQLEDRLIELTKVDTTSVWPVRN